MRTLTIFLQQIKNQYNKIRNNKKCAARKRKQRRDKGENGNSNKVTHHYINTKKNSLHTLCLSVQKSREDVSNVVAQNGAQNQDHDENGDNRSNEDRQNDVKDDPEINGFKFTHAGCVHKLL